MNKRNAIIGLTNLHFSKLLTDPEVGPATYEASIRVPGIISCECQPSGNTQSIFADDSVFQVATVALGISSINLTVAQIGNKLAAYLLGYQYDENTGAVTAEADSQAPWIAMGFALKKSNGAERYVWYYKCKFFAVDDAYRTKADQIDWSTAVLQGTFMQRINDKAYRISIDTDDTRVPSYVKNAWFDKPDSWVTGSDNVQIGNVLYFNSADELIQSGMFLEVG